MAQAVLEKADLVRLLYPLSFHTEKCLLKTTKVYLRNVSLLNQLLGIQNPAKLEGFPGGMRVFAGFMNQQIFIREQAKGGVCSFHYYGGFDGAHIDLILNQPGSRIGILFRFTDRIGPKNWTRLKSIIRREIIKRGFVVYTGRRGFSLPEIFWLYRRYAFLITTTSGLKKARSRSVFEKP